MRVSSQKGFTFIEVMLVLIFVAVIAFAGYYVYSQNKDDSEDATVTAGKSASPNAKPDPLADWKTYTDDEFGYSLKMPKDWQFKKGEPAKIEGSDEVLTDSEGEVIMESDSIVPTGNDNIEGISTVHTHRSTASPKDYFIENGVGRAGYEGDGKETTINGYQAFIANNKHMGSEYTVVTIAHEGKIVEFLYNNLAKNGTNGVMCDKIIRTIKFL